MGHRLIGALALLGFVLGSLAAAAEADSLPKGQWLLLTEGTIADLWIYDIDPQGNLDAGAFGRVVVGTWDSTSHRISFVDQGGLVELARISIYVGHLFTVPAGGATTYVLAGTATGLPAGGFPVNQPEKGWIAIITPPPQ